MAFVFPTLSMTVGGALLRTGYVDICSPVGKYYYISLVDMVPGLVAVFYTIPIVAGVLEVVIFMGMSGWVTEQRRHFWRGDNYELDFPENFSSKP